jgi:hypothetical protein
MAFADAVEQLNPEGGQCKTSKKTSKVVQGVAAKTVEGALPTS